MKYAYVLTSETKYWNKKIYGVYSSFNKAVNDALDLIEQNPDTCKKSETATNGRFTGLKITQWNMNKQTAKDEWYANQTETNMFVFAGYNNQFYARQIPSESLDHLVKQSQVGSNKKFCLKIYGGYYYVSI